MTTALATENIQIQNDCSVTILAHALSEAISRIDKANRRLERAGINERFTYTATERVVTREKDGITQSVTVVDLVLNAPKIKVNGWTFIASLDIMDNGTITRVAPGADTTGMPVPREHHCDHCHTNRVRKYSFMLRSDDGQWMQVGKSCLQVFLGARPNGLWSLSYDPFNDMDVVDNEDVDRMLFGSGAERSFDSRQVIALAWVLSDHGRFFVTRSAAQKSEGNLIATSSEVSDVLYGTTDRHWAQQQVAAAAEVDDETVDKILAAVDTVDPDSDYGRNLRVVFGGESISSRHLGLACSLIKVYVGPQNRKETPVIVDEVLAESGTKISDVDGTVQVLTYVDTAYGVSGILVIRTDSGHLIKWFSGSIPDEVDGEILEVGQRVRILRATIKGEDHFGGHTQTSVVRVKLGRP